jgi:hypothetical protein
MSMAENIVKYYFYQDIDAAFFNVISSVKQNIENRKKIFAKVLQLKKSDEKHVVVYVRSSNDKLGEIDEDDYRLVYVANLGEQGLTLNKAADITYGNVYDGNINVDPLNIYYAGKRKFQMFKNMDKYIDCKDEECVKELQKCDNEDFFIDDFTKFNDDDDKPYTHMFCRRYGVRELADKLNKIDNFDKFKMKLLELSETSDKLMIAVQEYLSEVGSDKIKDFLNKIRYPIVELNEEERKLFNQLKELIENNKYNDFKLLMISKLNTSQNMAIKIKNALYLSGSSDLKDAVLRLDKERDEETAQKARELVRLANTRSKPSIFSKASEAMEYASKLARRSMKQLKKYGEERQKKFSERRRPEQTYKEPMPYMWVPGMEFPYFLDQEEQQSSAGDVSSLSINIPPRNEDSSSEKRSPRSKSPKSPKTPRNE